MAPMVASNSPALALGSPELAFSYNMQNSRGSNLFSGGVFVQQGLLQKCGTFCSSWLTTSFPLKYNLPVLVLGFRIGLCGIRLGESTEAADVV